MSTQAKVPVGSRWKSINSDRVLVCIERFPFGRLDFKEEGRAMFVGMYQKAFLLNHLRLPDIAEATPRPTALNQNAME